ncbi:MAG: hypothetical protein WC486_00215 [Candidatus Omnitrophota bacterium]
MEQQTSAELSFKTTSLYLAAAILAQISESRFFGCNPKEQIDGRSVFVIFYPASFREAIDDILVQFNRKELSVNLYAFSKKLHILRDELKGGGPPNGT